MAASSLPCLSDFSAWRRVAARSKATASVHRIQERWRSKRTAMDVGVAVARDGVEMIRSGVAFVAIESVARITSVELQHAAVARDLGDDRRGGDGGAAPVAVQHAALRHRQIGHAK